MPRIHVARWISWENEVQYSVRRRKRNVNLCETDIKRVVYQHQSCGHGNRETKGSNYFILFLFGLYNVVDT